MIAQSKQVLDLNTPLYAGSGFIMGLAGVSPVSWIAMQLGFKIFSQTLSGRGQAEASMNTLGDVTVSFLAYLGGRKTRGQLTLTQEAPLPEVQPAPKQEIPV